MSRWRPPPERATALVTRAGFRRLQAELDELWRQRRPEVVRALAAAAAEGDRSENAEYTYRKKQLAEIDRRVRYLGKRLPLLRVVDTVPGDRDAVWFGARVAVQRDGDGQRACYRLVGPDEIDAAAGCISIDSPLARAVLRRRVDDEVEAELPGGVARLRILAIDYDAVDDEAGV